MALFARLKTRNSGDDIVGADDDADWDNIINNLVPDKLEDWSTNVTQMQGTTDPYPASVESLATNLQGELERIRYVIKQITGKAQWYIDPSNSLDSLIPSGTVMVFYQAAAPTGWTQVTTQNDKALRVVSGTGGGVGGTHGFSAFPANSANASGDHTHTGPSHTHTLADGTQLTNTFVTTNQYSVRWSGDTTNIRHITTGGGGVTVNALQYTTNADGAAATGGQSATHTHGLGLSPNYIDVIICSKN